MDYEKKYNEALERAKQKIDAGFLTEDDLAYIFPELLESEDERARKAALEGIEYLERKLGWDAIGDTDILDVKEYLQKQKEQKPAEKQDYIGLQDYSGLTDLERAIHRGFLSAGVDNVPVTIIKETAKECLAQMNPAEWSEEDEKFFALLHSSLYQIKVRIGKDEYDRAVAWLRSLRPQPKQEVTDEEIEKMVINRSRSSGTTKSEVAFYRNGIKDAIKRFGLRPSWKPSKEQMNVFKNTLERLRITIQRIRKEGNHE